MKIDYKKITGTHWYRQEITSVNYFALGPSWGCLQLLKGGWQVYWYLKENNTRNYLSEEYFLQLAKSRFQKYKKDRQSLMTVYQKWLNWNKNFERLINQARSLDLYKLTDQQLLKWNYRLGLKARQFWHQGFFIDIFDTNTEEFIKQELVNANLKIKSEEINILLKSPSLFAGQQYHLDLLKLSSLLKRRSDDNKLSPIIKKQLQLIVKKHYFIYNSFAQASHLTDKIILRDVNHLTNPTVLLKQELRRLENYQAESARQKEAIFKYYHFSKWLRDVFYFFAILGLWRDQRKVILQKTIAALDKLGREIAFRSKMPWSTVSLCVPYFIKKIPVPLKTVNYFKNLAINHYLNSWDRKLNKVVLLPKKTCDKLMKYFEINDSRIKELKGQVACQGKVKGTIRVIMGEKDFAKFKHDDVLVTVCTRPEFLPLMKKAKAIITDEGGITSHAAIISRELNKPCVIGTRVATRVFKDGEMVEVDAEVGIVRRLR